MAPERDDSGCSKHAPSQLADYLFGKLGAEERVELEEHLLECAVCRSALEELSVLRDARALDRDLKVPERVDRNVMAAIDGAFAVTPRPRSAAKSSPSSKRISRAVSRRLRARGTERPRSSWLAYPNSAGAADDGQIHRIRVTG